MYQHITQVVFNQPWAILPAKFEAITELMRFRTAGGRLTAEEIQARVGAASPPTPRSSGSVAVLPLYGVVAQRMGMMTQMSGGTSTDSFAQSFRQLINDPSVSAIVLDVDSPGGSVFGVQELADEIYNARGTKPVIAVANSLAASAAYWIASAADELVVTPSGQVGSIGVIAQYEDDSEALAAGGLRVETFTAGKYKGEGAPGTSLTDDARQNIQDQINAYYDAFVGTVARNRGTTASAVRNGYGEGRVVVAKQAVQQGLADRVATLDQTIARLASPRGLGKARSARASHEAGVESEAVALLAAGYQPEPYQRDADETVQCPNCHKYNAPDAEYCDQCGAKLAGRDDVQVDNRGGNQVDAPHHHDNHAPPAPAQRGPSQPDDSGAAGDTYGSDGAQSATTPPEDSTESRAADLELRRRRLRLSSY